MLVVWMDDFDSGGSTLLDCPKLRVSPPAHANSGNKEKRTETPTTDEQKI